LTRAALASSPATVAPSHRRHGYRFIREFVTQPFVIGAVAPSSSYLAMKMVEGVDLSSASAVVEFGPGTGAFTDVILPRLPGACKYFAIELNPAMARIWESRHPGAKLHLDSVAHVDRLCEREGIKEVDVIFSGLPWASFDDSLQEEILDATMKVLRPGGQLITFGYRVGTLLPKGRRFYRRLPEYFSSVRRSEYVWRNLPPAFVVRCTK
jgi:phosphatidylethanolamine/phosphatidyl-N-methylethanolamine N-methyltransferase